MAIITTPYPAILTPNTLEDANQVMQDFNYIATQVNANAAALAASNTFTQPQVASNATLRTHLITAAQVQDGVAQLLTGVAGTNTITASAAFSMIAYAKGQSFTLIPAVTNTGAVTININTIGAVAIKKNGNNAMIAGDLVAGTVYTIVHDGSNFQVETPLGTTTNYQAFTANGTWTKPAGLSGNEMIFVQMWGGGGGGATFTHSGGGGGGSYKEFYVLASSLGATVAVTVGAQAAIGTAGNNSVFAGVTAYGGGCGANVGGGGGGGGMAKGTNAAGGATAGGAGGLGYASNTAAATNVDGPSDCGGGGGTGNLSGIGTAGGCSFWGGGGGGGGTSTQTVGASGGNSMFGGGGGGGGTDLAHESGAAGLSQFGGNGGASADSDGHAPGGGGSGLQGDAGTCKGARGEVRVWVLR